MIVLIMEVWVRARKTIWAYVCIEGRRGESEPDNDTFIITMARDRLS